MMTVVIGNTGTLTNKKQKIYEEAARLFCDKGFSATSVRDLATAVGLEPSSLYSHISSKEEILQHICFNSASRFLEGLQEIRNAGKSPSDKLRDLIDMHVDIAQTDATSIIVFNDEWRHLTEPYLSQFIALRKQYEDGCAAIINDGKSKGHFRNIKPFIVLNTLLSSTVWIHRSSRAHSLNHTKISGQIADMILFGLQEKEV